MSEVEKWQLKRLLKQLNEMQGSGTSVISQYIPGNTAVAQYTSRLQNEYGLADANIKSASNKKSVLEAITSATTRLKDYHKSPANGLVILAGNVTGDNGREKRMSLALHPFKPLNLSKYHCGSKFFLEPLEELLQDSQKYGFVIMDGGGVMFATVQGSHREILTRKSVDLPKKHKKGGQSSQRFQRIRLEKRNAYLKMVSDMAVQMFIANNTPNIDGLIMAGHAEFKNDLANATFLDKRLKDRMIAAVDVAYGDEPGLNQAIDAVKEQLGHLELVKEKRTVQRLFHEIATSSGLCVFGHKETVEAIGAGAVETVLVHEGLEWQYDPATSTLFKPGTGGEHLLFVDYLAENYKQMGVEVSIVTGQTGEGHQFVQGFGGLAGILRYPYTPNTETEVPVASEPKTTGADEGTDVPGNYQFTEDDFM